MTSAASPRRWLLAPVACAACLWLAGCAGSGRPEPIPADDAAFLIGQIEEVEQRVAAGACDGLRRGTFVRLDRAVGRLPEDVDGDVRQALVDGVDHLEGLAEDECEANRPQEPVDEAPDTTTTTPPETTTEEEPPPEEDEGDEGQSPPTDTTQPGGGPPETPPGQAPPADDQGAEGQGPPAQGNGGTGAPPAAVPRGVGR